MDLERIVAGITADLRRAGAIGGEQTERAAELLAAGVEPTVRLHLLEALYEAAREIEDSAPGIRVSVRLEGRDPVLAVVDAPAPPMAEPVEGEPLGSFAEDELRRLTVRLPEGLKSRIEQDAASTGASINSLVVAAVARALEGTGDHRPSPGRRTPRRMTGFVQG